VRLQFAGRDAPSTVISFAQKSLKDGQVVSKLHVIELGAVPGETRGLHRHPCCSTGMLSAKQQAAWAQPDWGGLGGYLGFLPEALQGQQCGCWRYMQEHGTWLAGEGRGMQMVPMGSSWE